jgi:plasmid stabilization system protein ParE
MPRVRVHQLVGTEFGEALTWYGRFSPLAAEHFATRFDAAFDRIQLRPTAQAYWRSPFRRTRLKRFPYLLIFHADQTGISVLALVHERRNPNSVLRQLTLRRKDLTSM